MPGEQGKSKYFREMAQEKAPGPFFYLKTFDSSFVTDIILGFPLVENVWSNKKHEEFCSKKRRYKPQMAFS